MTRIKTFVAVCDGFARNLAAFFGLNAQSKFNQGFG
jgi:hypothetical protein